MAYRHGLQNTAAGASLRVQRLIARSGYSGQLWIIQAGGKMMSDSRGEQRSFNLTPFSRAVLLSCGAPIAVAAGPDAVAQEVAPLEEIIVTARKRTESLQDVPISVMAFGADAIVKQAP